MKTFSETISHTIESQFPSLYREEGQELIEFTKAYYEFLEESDDYSVKVGRQMFSANDIDDSLEEFITHFKQKYLADLPFMTSTDKRFMVKHIMDMYRSKGSKQSLELFMRMLFNEDVDVYIPGDDILRASDSEWYRPVYLEVSKSPKTTSLLDQQITGSTSGATAFVEGIVTKRISGKLIDVLYLSNVRGRFEFGERISSDGNLIDSPIISGSLTDINITLGGRDNKIGDVFDVISSDGAQGKVRVSAIEDATGRVDFELIDGGYGFTNVDDYRATDVYISDAVLSVDNSSEEFIDFETVVQRIETISTLSSSDINSANTGDFIIGRNGTGTEVANGIIISVANTDANGDIITTPSANSLMTVQVLDGATFSDQKLIQTSSPQAFIEGETLEEESKVTLDVSSVVGSFTIGQFAKQIFREPVNNNIIDIALGEITSANSSQIVLEPAWGAFDTTTAIELDTDPGVTASVDTVTILPSETGARATITSVDGANVAVNTLVGEFNAGKQVRGRGTKLIETISTVDDTGASDLWLNGISTANGVVDTVANNYAEGIIVGQNTTAIGVWGNTSPFFFDESGDFFVETVRDTLITLDPVPDISKEILEIKTGEGADFNIGFLENTETVTINTDIVGANNVVGVPYIQILVSGEGSGVGFIDSITINNGGTQYSNGSIVTFSGGGVGNGETFVPAQGTISTDGSGIITAITMTVPGEGYFIEPVANLPATSGTIADISLNMDYGYGFPLLPDGDQDNLIEDLLTSDSFTIGTIASLTGINPGTNYNADPFVRIRNKFIAGFGRRDFFATVNTLSGAFTVGESLSQDVGGGSTAKGKVKSFTNNGDGTGIIEIDRNSFAISFIDGVPITGDSSGASAIVETVSNNDDSRPIGDNADIAGTVIAADGIATEVEVIDSGYGYIEGREVVLSREGFNFVIEGDALVQNEGISEGYWRTTTSHLNSEKRLQDSRYYQEYSYDVVSGISLNRYRDALKDVLHVAGNELFGSISKTSNLDSSISIKESEIEVV